MKTISKLKIGSVVFLSLCSSSVFAGVGPITVSEPSVLALLGAGAAVVLYAAIKRKK